MWGLATIYNDSPSPEVGAAVEKAMDFFIQNSRLTRDGQRYVIYPGDNVGRIGTVALCAARSYRLPTCCQIPDYRRKNSKTIANCLKSTLNFSLGHVYKCPHRKGFGIKATVSLDTRMGQLLPTSTVNPCSHWLKPQNIWGVEICSPLSSLPLMPAITTIFKKLFRKIRIRL